MQSIHFRPWQSQDATAFATAVNDSLDTLLPWMVWAHPYYSVEEAEDWIRYTQIVREKGEADELAITDAHGELLGGCGIRYPADRLCLPAIGYWVKTRAQRQGIATRAVHYLAEKGFSFPHVQTIEILAAADNLASRQVAHRAGAEFIDTRYGLIILDKGPVNTAIYHLKRPT